MNAKIEFGVVWILSILSVATQSDIMFVFSIGASTTIILRNLPGAIKVIKSLKKKDNA